MNVEKTNLSGRAWGQLRSHFVLPSSGLSVVSVDFNSGDQLPISDKDNYNDKMSDVSRQMFSGEKTRNF